MSRINWDDEPKESDIPRSLTLEEIDSIISNLKFNNEHTIIQDNLINIHREKTTQKLKTIKIKASKIQQLRQTIIEQFFKSMIATGEAVGINAAQCIGEPTTQLTLNSVAPYEEIFININGNVMLVKIGEWIDKLLDENSDKIVFIPENRTEYLELSENVKILSPDENGIIKWDIVSAITRHLPVGNLVKVRTSYGRTATVTKHKSLLIWDGNIITEKNADDIKIGDLVPIIYKIQEKADIKAFNSPYGELYGLYYCYGSFLDDNIIFNGSFNILKRIRDVCGYYNIDYEIKNSSICIKKQQWPIFTTTDTIPECVFRATHTFISGFLKAIFSKYGIVNYNKEFSLVLTSNSNELIKTYKFLLYYFGIFCEFTYENDIYTLSIYKDNCHKFITYIGSSDIKQTIQMQQYNSMIELNNNDLRVFGDVVLDPIISVQDVKPTQFVYDLTVSRTKNFSLSNGICVRDTFHSTGISAKNVTLGFPRARELFNATKSQSNPSCTIYFMKDNDTPEKLHKYTDKMPEFIIDQLLVKNGYKVYNPEEFELKNWHFVWYKLNNKTAELTEDEWILRLEFNLEKLYENNLTVAEIAKKLETNYTDMYCIPSPLNLGLIDIVVNCIEINPPDKSFETEDIYTARTFYMNNIISPKIRGLQCCGIQGISKIYYRYADVDETFGGFKLKEHIADRLKTKKEWIAETDGTNLEEILCLPGIDPYRTMSNDMWEICNILGIEAARRYLFLEFMNIAKNGGISINPVHFEILVSKMTYTGAIRAITRFGVETLQYGPIARATFEEVMSQLVTSSVFSETDHLNGISSNIVLGTRINAGTGIVNLDTIPLRVVKEKTEN
jgi:DNA-directed RNA polymerase beta' subunit